LLGTLSLLKDNVFLLALLHEAALLLGLYIYIYICGRRRGEALGLVKG
jgi:hypothetical protein